MNAQPLVPRSFEELYRQESMRIRSFLLRRTLDPELAGDLTAETFSYAYVKWRTLRGRAPEERQAWLYTIARRRLYNHLRRRSVERRALRRLGAQTCSYHEDDLAQIGERDRLAQLQSRLKRELGRLRPGQRAALELRIMQGRDYAEVARQLGVTELAARSRVSRGLRALSRAMDRQAKSS